MSGHPEDPIPALVAMADQLVASMPQLSRIAKAWYDAYMERGFTDSQALYLTATQLTSSPGKAP